MNSSKAPAARREAPLAAGGKAAGDCPFESRTATAASHLPSLAARA